MKAEFIWGLLLFGPIAFRAIAGTPYHTSAGVGPETPAQTMRASVSRGHPNDDFTNPAPLSGLMVGWTNTTLGATSEPGEEILSNTYPASVWAQWTAPQSGHFRIMPGLLTFTSQLSVYRGDSLSSLEKVSTVASTSISLYADAGVTYFIRVASNDFEARDFTLRLGPLAPNETPVSATELTGTNITVNLSSWTLPGHLSSASPPPALWYKWAAPAHGFLSYHVPSNTVWTTLSAFHLKAPTVDSNIVMSKNYSTSVQRTLPIKDTIAVTEGITYLFAIRASPSTNIPFQLGFQSVPINLGSYTNLLLGGSVLASLQNTNYLTPPDALQLGPLTGNQNAWIEMVFVGRGVLHYRRKLSGSQFYFTTAFAPAQPSGPLFSSPHDWVYASLELWNDTNIVRWTLRNSDAFFAGTSTAWFDDIEFFPAPPLRPRLYLSPNEFASLQMTVFLEANRTTTIDTATNLVNWLPWTNLLSPSTTYRSLKIPAATNEIPQFFRARVIP